MMTTITIDANQKLGRIKPMHSVGQPPLFYSDTKLFSYLKEANIPYSRLHDVGGRFGGGVYVDIPNVFRDFDADVNDPASYDFAFTDVLIKGLIENDCAPIYRLGVTIENAHAIRAYRIFPPKDNAKWARICEHIIRHYNEGWADGFHYGIKYWEIWNEPDGHPDIEQNATWKGTKEEYFDLYRVTSKHLRACFGNTIKIGGYASCGFYAVKENQDVTGAAFGVLDKPMTNWERRMNYFMEFFHDFVDMVKTEKLPFDFFSHHSYCSVTDNLKMQAYCEQYLEEHGFGDVEIHLNEWNTHPQNEYKGKRAPCANAVALLCAMQNTKMEMMCYYDMRIAAGGYSGFFNPLTIEPFCIYYGFKAFGKLYALGQQVACTSDNEQVYALAATDGKTLGVLVSNIGEDTEVSMSLLAGAKAYLVDEAHMLEETELDASEFTLEKDQVVYFEL